MFGMMCVEAIICSDAPNVMLTAGSLSGIGQLSSNLLTGMGQNYSWVEDSDAGTVLQCSKVSKLLHLHGIKKYLL